VSDILDQLKVLMVPLGIQIIREWSI